MSAEGVLLEKVIGFVPKGENKQRIMRWHVMAGLCLINGYRNGVELGVSQGRFTSYLCATMHDMHMTAVDLWEGFDNTDKEGGQDYREWPHNEHLERFKGLCADYFPNRVRIMRMDTVKAAKFFEDESIDFVFIDADHSYEGCSRDIEAWVPKVRSRGIVAGHDFNWPTVKRAVVERLNPIARASDHVWTWVKP